MDFKRTSNGFQAYMRAVVLIWPGPWQAMTTPQAGTSAIGRRPFWSIYKDSDCGRIMLYLGDLLDGRFGGHTRHAEQMSYALRSICNVFLANNLSLLRRVCSVVLGPPMWSIGRPVV